MRKDNKSITMIPVNLEKKVNVSVELLRHIPSYARMCCEGQEQEASHMMSSTPNSRKGRKIVE